MKEPHTDSTDICITNSVIYVLYTSELVNNIVALLLEGA